MNVQKASEKDLEEFNRVITDAVMQWDLPDRVKRLSLSSFHYDVHDLQHMDIYVAKDDEQTIIGVIACEMTDLPSEILLHGIFVRPNDQRKGVGKLLLETVEQNLPSSMIRTIVVKPQKGAQSFFRALGFERVKSHGKNQYENLMIKERA